MLTDEAIVSAVDAPIMARDDVQPLLFSNFVRVGAAVNGFRQAIGLEPTAGSAGDPQWGWGGQGRE